MTEKTALHYDTESGLCRPTIVLVDDQGIPTTANGYEFKRVRGGINKVEGWHSLDGPCVEWRHAGGAYSVLIPREAR
jgi:hypothetical protein